MGLFCVNGVQIKYIVMKRVGSDDYVKPQLCNLPAVVFQ